MGNFSQEMGCADRHLVAGEFNFDCCVTQLQDFQGEGTDTGGRFLQQVTSDFDEAR